MTRIPALEVALALGWLAGACAGDPEGAARRSALLVTLDTTRADALACYGNANVATPVLDALAAEGVLFEAAHTVTALTLPAHASMLTGLAPPRHGLRDNGMGALPASARTLAEAARDAGLATAAFVSSVVLDDSFGLDQGFSTYGVPRRKGAGIERGHGAERPASATIDAALAWLDALGSDQPFFLWVHLYDAHHPYAPPAPFDAEYAAQPYLGEVAAMDRELGRLFGRLRERGALERTFVLVLADHGEAFGEHGELTHGAYCYEPTLRIPMIARWPEGAAENGGRRAGERSNELAGVVDVAPTLAEALGLAPLEGIDGLSFYRRTLPQDRGLYVESYYGFLAYGWSPLAGWIDARGKYLHSSEPELYEWKSEPAEVRDLALEQPGEVERYRRSIAELVARPKLELEAGSVAVVDDEALEDIRALGYAGSAEAASALPGPLDPSELPSPRSQSTFLSRQAHAQELSEAGKHEEAARIYEEILRETPGNPFAMDELATLRLRQGRAEEAAALLGELARSSPSRARTHYKLGLALRQAKRFDEAVDALRRSVELSQGRPRYLETLIETLEKLGRQDEAHEIAQRYRKG